MKKNNFFISMLLCLGACFVIGCSDKEELESISTKSVDISLEFQKASLVSTKSDALDGDLEEVPYCDEGVAIGDYVVASYYVEFYDKNGAATGENLVDQILEWEITQLETVDSTLSQLVQIDYPEFADSAYFIIEDFRVLDAKDGNVKFITPKSTSAYADYVSTPVEMVFPIGLYEKQYMKMEVLCFEEEDIEKFGFAWSDFDVVTGDEVCMFFNCLGTTAENYHQVLAAEQIEAYYMDASEGWVSYWDGSNISEDGTAEAFCIPCPANWSTEGIQLQVTPDGGDKVFTVSVTSEQISAFLYGVPASFVDAIEAEYTATVDSTVEAGIATRYVHYTFNECTATEEPEEPEEPEVPEDPVTSTYQAYYSNITTHDGKKSEIFGLSWGDGVPTEENFTQTSLFTLDDKWHLAASADGKYLFAVNSIGTSGWGSDLSVFDTENFDEVKLTFVLPTDRDAPATEYKLSQLVYVDGTLYGGCATNECLVELIYDLDKETFTYGDDLIDTSDSGAITGGDLLYTADGTENNLFSFTRKGGYIQYSNLDGTVSQEYTKDDNVKVATGACMVGTDGALISTSFGDNQGYTFQYWSNGIGVTIFESDEKVGVSGDMASYYTGTTLAQFTTIFGL